MMKTKITKIDGLELIQVIPAQANQAPPLLLIHGAFSGAWCWQKHFIPYWAAQGYRCYALSLAGHGASEDHAMLDTYSIADYVSNVERIVAELPQAPVLIGHSMGGFVVQKYLERQAAAGAILLSSVPPQGLWGSSVNLLLTRPTVLHDLNRVLGGGQPNLEVLQQALFYQAIPATELAEFYQKMQPESHRAVWDMTLFDLPQTFKIHPTPIAVMGGAQDVLIPPTQMRMTGWSYGVETQLFANLGHALMLEPGWEVAAQAISDWLTRQYL
jgi:non-heme chloroperoxidase